MVSSHQDGGRFYQRKRQEKEAHGVHNRPDPNGIKSGKTVETESVWYGSFNLVRKTSFCSTGSVALWVIMRQWSGRQLIQTPLLSVDHKLPNIFTGVRDWLNTVTSHT